MNLFREELSVWLLLIVMSDLKGFATTADGKSLNYLVYTDKYCNGQCSIERCVPDIPKDGLSVRKCMPRDRKEQEKEGEIEIVEDNDDTTDLEYALGFGLLGAFLIVCGVALATCHIRGRRKRQSRREAAAAKIEVVAVQPPQSSARDDHRVVFGGRPTPAECCMREDSTTTIQENDENDQRILIGPDRHPIVNKRIGPDGCQEMNKNNNDSSNNTYLDGDRDRSMPGYDTNNRRHRCEDDYDDESIRRDDRYDEARRGHNNDERRHHEPNEIERHDHYENDERRLQDHDDNERRHREQDESRRHDHYDDEKNYYHENLHRHYDDSTRYDNNDSDRKFYRYLA